MNTETESTKLLGVGDLMRKAWAFYKSNFRKLWPLFLLGGFGSFGFRFGSSARGIHANFPASVWAVIIIVGLTVAVFLFLSKIALYSAVSQSYKGQYVGFKDSYKKSLALFWPFILLSILSVVSVFSGFLLLIIPGIILGGYLVFSQMTFFVEEKKGFNAMLSSWSLVKGYWWATFGRILSYALIVGLGSFFGVGILIGAAAFVGYLLYQAVPLLGMVLLTLVVVAAIVFMFLFLAPFSLIFFFELYFSLRAVKASEPAEDASVHVKRKRKLIALLVVAVLAIGPLTYAGIKFVEFVGKLESSAAHQPMQEYHSDIGSFSVNFPGGKPMTYVKEIGPESAPYNQYSFVTETPANNFEVVYIPFPSSVSLTQDPEKVLTTYMTGATRRTGAVLATSSLGYYKGYHSIDFLVYSVKDNAYLKTRVVLDGQNFYDLLVSYPKDANTDQNSLAADAFFDSFSLAGSSTAAPVDPSSKVPVLQMNPSEQ